jgi:hypothetical protein
VSSAAVRESPARGAQHFHADLRNTARVASLADLREAHLLARLALGGRKTLANTLKYVLVAMSANVGNMISLAVASLWLPCLPLVRRVET